MPPAKELDKRNCIVCKTEFQPTRKDQIYCGTSGKYDCWNKLRMAIEQSAVLIARAMAFQNWKCWGCGQSGLQFGDAVVEEAPKTGVWESTRLARQGKVKLAPLCARPDKVGRDERLLDGDIVVSCKGCRKDYYLALATGEKWIRKTEQGG